MSVSQGNTLWKVYGATTRFDKPFQHQRSLMNVNLFNPKPGDCVLFHGGADIWPGLYGETPIFDCSTKNLLIRDAAERRIMEECLERNIPMLGICRGAQHLCAFAGGTLFQHVDGHQGVNHGLQTSTGEEFDYVPADHHQIMRPSCDNRCVWTPLAWTKVRQNRIILCGKEAPPADDWEESWELEVVYFNAIRGLAIQPHPEWDTTDRARPFNEYIDKLVDEYILAQ